MNFNTIKQQIEMIIMKNRWLYSLLLVSIIYLVLFYFNFTAYIGDFFEEEKYGFCMHCNGSVILEHANVLELCYIELLSGDGSPYSILSVGSTHPTGVLSLLSWVFKRIMLVLTTLNVLIGYHFYLTDADLSV